MNKEEISYIYIYVFVFFPSGDLNGSLALPGALWCFLVIHGATWRSLVLHGPPSLVLPGAPWCSLAPFYCSLSDMHNHAFMIYGTYYMGYYII